MPLIRAAGCPAEVAGCPLAADFAFEGNGPEGYVQIGIERKTIPDLLASLRDKRLDCSQMGDFIAAYPYRWLLIEGRMRRGGDGYVEVGKVVRFGRISALPSDGSLETIRWRIAEGHHRWDAVQHALSSITWQSDTAVAFTRDEEESAAWLANEHAWWQKPWEAHSTGRGLYIPPLPLKPREAASGLWRSKKASVKEAWLAALPGVHGMAVELAKHFRLPEDIALSGMNVTTKPGVKFWEDLPGIGKGKARGIWAAIHEEEK